MAHGFLYLVAILDVATSTPVRLPVSGGGPVEFLADGTVMVETLSDQATIEAHFIRHGDILTVLDVLWPAVACVLLMHWLGLYLASALYMGFYMRRFGHYPWLAAVSVSVVFAVSVFLIFEIWFLVPMPKGPIEVWLGY